LDNFLASIVANYTSSNNFTISFVANVLPFLCGAEGNPDVGKHSGTLLTHFG